MISYRIGTMFRVTTFLPCMVFLLFFGSGRIHCFPGGLTSRAANANEEAENFVKFLRSLNLEITRTDDGIKEVQRDSDKRQITSEQKLYVDAHNVARANVKPSAANMVKMKWSDELAAVAQNYANKCIWGHNSARTNETYRLTSQFSYVGENLYLATGSIDPFGVVESWDSEKKYYTHRLNTCRQTCGHYTQVVWADSEYVGCASKTCSSISGSPSYDYGGTIVVCNYGEGGNYEGRKPYVSGTPCSFCPSGYSCSGNLCVAGNDTSSSSGSGGSMTNTGNQTTTWNQTNSWNQTPSWNQTITWNQTIPDKDCYTGDGSSYTGTVSTTLNGKTCLKWSDVYPFLPNNNYCRNYFSKLDTTQPVCYMKPGSLLTEPCGIPKCG